MKQIIINITEIENDKAIILNCTNKDDTKLVKVIQPGIITEEDNIFIEKLKELIQEHYGN